jgi:transposase InsO family protein
MCQVLEISTSTYYKYRYTKDKDYGDYLLIKEIFDSSKKTYGYRRIYDELRDDYGMLINHKKVARIMNKYGVIAEYIKQLKHNYTKQYVQENAREDLLQRNFEQRGWVTDITYLQLSRNGKKAFLSTILDLESRNWVAFKISYRNDNSLVINTLKEAISKTKDLSGLTIHSDQGYQYLSTEYKIICESNGLTISHSRKGTPLDNAVIESFHSILKKETLYNNSITTLKEYVQLVIDWLYFYNTKRRRLKKK